MVRIKPHPMGLRVHGCIDRTNTGVHSDRFLGLIGVVESVSPSLEEASQTLRADRWTSFKTVTPLPLIRPGLVTHSCLGLLRALADFGNLWF